MHDPGMFPDPDDFRPERFIDVKDPRMANFELPFGQFPPHLISPSHPLVEEVFAASH